MENVYHPRCLFFDTDPQIQKLNKLSNTPLFKQENIISGNEDASSNFGRGCMFSSQMKDFIDERLRKMMEKCDSIEGLLVTHSIGGGTGSGCSKLLYDMQLEKTPISSFTVFPTSTYSTSTLEPYNAVLTFNYLCDSMKCIYAYDNYSLLNVCQESGIKNPYYKEMNHLISQSISTLTSQHRFSNEGNFHDVMPISQNITNIISNSFVNLNDTTNVDMNIKDLFSKKTLMNSTDYFDGISLGMNISMRGDFSKNYVNSMSEQLNTELKFANGHQFKYQITNKVSENIHTDSFKFENVMHVANNTTSITNYLNNLLSNFNKLFRKCAFYHWIVGDGGYGSDGIYEAREHLSHTIDCYSSFTNN